MTWRDIDRDELIIYLSDWRTRDDIKNHFNLSNVSSWHCVKFLAKFNDVQCRRGMGITARSILYKARSFAINEAIRKMSSLKGQEGEKEDESIFSNTNNK